MTIEQQQQKFPVAKLVWGLVLLTLGTLFLLETIDIWDSGPFWTWWPLFLIVIGVAGEIDALRARKSDSSFIPLAIGVWMLAGSREIFGLSYQSAMPLAIVVAGLFIAIHAIVDRRDAPKKENQQ